jgi:predicted lipid-binding transport protein (Tim44 family)
MGDPAMGAPAMGDPAMGPGMESTWATDMPAPVDPSPAMTTDASAAPTEPEVAAHRATLLSLLLDDQLTAAHVGTTRNAMAKSASSAKADLAGARKALEATLSALTRADWNTLDAALPETVVREVVRKVGGADAADVRRQLREVYQDAGVSKARVLDVAAVGADWALASAACVDGDDDEVEAVALLIVEGGVWKVVLTW